MLNFARVITLTGSPRQTMPWATEITAYVNAHTDLTLTCWAATYGAPIGTTAWSTIVESQSVLAAETAKLLADDGYLDLVEQAAGLVAGPGEDRLRELVYGTPPSGPGAVGDIATVTTATANVGHMAKAIGWGVEIAQHVEKTTGAPLAFFTDVFGTMGQVTWIGGQPSLEAADAARGKIVADDTYLQMITASTDWFIPGSARTSQLVRIA